MSLVCYVKEAVALHAVGIYRGSAGEPSSPEHTPPKNTMHVRTPPKVTLHGIRTYDKTKRENVRTRQLRMWHECTGGRTRQLARVCTVRATCDALVAKARTSKDVDQAKGLLNWSGSG